MKNQLEYHRRRYGLARMSLSILNSTKAAPATKANALAHLNRVRGALQKEMKRVSWLLWPETGRPSIRTD